MYKVLIKKELGQVTLTLMDKQIRRVPMPIACRKSMLGYDLLEIDSSELIMYLTEASRMLKEVE